MIGKILLFGLITGLIHFFIMSILYANPLIDKTYKSFNNHPALKYWVSMKVYIIKMFLGTQIEIYILTAGFLYLRSLFTIPTSWSTAIILASIFSAIRVYPRFWNMWIQTTYPPKLLAIEFINGILSTFTVVISLKLLV